MKAYEIDLNLVPSGVLPRLDVSQYDKGQTITCVLWDGNTPFTLPNGSYASVAGTKPDGTGFTYACTYENSQPVVTITEQMTAVAGEVVCELVIIKGDERQGTVNFILDVERAALDQNTPISETDIPIIEQLPEIVAEVQASADEAEAWATGGESGTPSSTNNAKYWAEQSQSYAVGALHWKGNVAFANIPTTNLTVGDVYSVTDEFTTDSRFNEGAGIPCPAGTNIIWSDDSKWDLQAANAVYSFNGRKGAVVPASGDYSASQISSSAITGQTDVEGALSALNSNLSGLTASVTITPTAVNTYFEVDYPSGFTKSNCVIAGVMYNNGGSWFNAQESNIVVRLSNTKVGLYVVVSTVINKDFKIVLMKI